MEGLKDDNLGNKMLQVQLPVVYSYNAALLSSLSAIKC